MATAPPDVELVKAHVELIKAWITGGATIVAAVIVASIGTIGGAWIAKRHQRERDRQDKESQWRSHAIELTKLDADRLMEAYKSGARKDRMMPFILTFLANYRDLTELGSKTPRELYEKILSDRISYDQKDSSDEDYDRSG